MRAIILLFLILFCFGASAQAPKYRYGAIASGGLIIGASGQYGLVQTVHGIWKDNAYLGIGFGADWHYRRTYPVFVDFRYPLNKGRKTIFLYSDAGLNLPGSRGEEGLGGRWNRHDVKFRPGIYFDGGVGLLLPTYKSNDRFFFSVGFSEKRFHEIQTPQRMPDPSPWRQLEETRTVYVMQRLSIKLGLAF